MKRFFLLPALLLCLFGACVSQAPGEKEAAPPSVPETGNLQGTTKRFLFTDGLDGPRFHNLPPEAKTYLRTLAEAFRGKDQGFLISQGEAQYEKDLRHEYDEETYLAMLYRIDFYTEETPRAPPDLPRLEYTRVQALEYYDWKENGPFLEIKGLLHFQNGGTIPCGITLVWRLVEPKIIGIRP